MLSSVIRTATTDFVFALEKLAPTLEHDKTELRLMFIRITFIHIHNQNARAKNVFVKGKKLSCDTALVVLFLEYAISDEYYLKI